MRTRRRNRWIAIALFTAAILFVARDRFIPEKEPMQIPDSPPAEAGLNPEKLTAFMMAVGGRGAVIKDGRFVAEWGTTDPGEVALRRQGTVRAHPLHRIGRRPDRISG